MHCLKTPALLPAFFTITPVSDTMNRYLSTIFAALILLVPSAHAVAPLSPGQCRGSAMPYVAPKYVVAHPDSLTPVMINHVGRHGARYLTSADKVNKILGFLDEAAHSGKITPLGTELRTLCHKVIDASVGRWGTLDTIGMAEQAGIARRMCEAYPRLVKGATVEALSSYVPRCVMSMDCFTHEMTRCDNSVTVYTSSGRINSPLMRPFDLDTAYIAYSHDKPYQPAYKHFYDSLVSTAPALRLTTADIETRRLRDATMEEFGMLAGLAAMGIDVDLTRYFTIEELNDIWTVRNLEQYLVRTASCYSTLPADIAATLLRDIISTTDRVISGTLDARIQLRFGHAETMMPLLSLMRLPGCYYVSDNLATVAGHWRNFHVVPMASNLQLKLFKAPSGRYYVRADLNEIPVPLIAGRPDIYLPWDEARTYLLSLLPK